MAQALLFDDYTPSAPEEFARLQVREVGQASILQKGQGSTSCYDFTLNPYIGCGFDCTYCFATMFQADEERRQTWGTWVDVKINAARKLLRRADLRGKTIFMSSATDPYQPLESKVRLTRSILEVLVEKQPRLVVQTRGPLVARDIDLLGKLHFKRVNMSITTDSEFVRRRFEPFCASIARRLEAITQIAEAGIPTTICVVPMLPIENPKAFAALLRSTGARYFAAAPFRMSDRKFAASTRPLGLEVADSMGWDRAGYERCYRELKRWLPELNEGGRGFHPE